MDQVYVPEWVGIKSETREFIRKVFGVPKSSSAIVETDSFGKSKVHSDGCTNSDLQTLTIEKMTTYLGGASENDTVHSLLNKVVSMIENPIVIDVPVAIPATTSIKKCEHCDFTTASVFAMRMHVGRKHPKR